MSDKILNTQIRHSVRKFIDTSSSTFDSLFPANHDSVNSPVSINRRSIDYTSGSQFDSTVVLKLPQLGYIGENYLEIDLAQVTTNDNWADYIGLSLIRRFTVKNAGVTLQEHDYLEAMEYALSNMTNDSRNTLLRLVGGTGFQRGKVLVPLPCFWSYMLHAGFNPVPAHILNSPLTFCEGDRILKESQFGYGSPSYDAIISPQPVYFEAPVQIKRNLR